MSAPPPEEPPASPAADAFCSICREEACELDRCVVPGCAHVFHVACILTWCKVRESCPLCVAPLCRLRVRRSVSGAALPDGVSVEESVALLRHAPWVELRDVHTALHDIEASFVPPPMNALTISERQAAAAGASSSPAPYYLNEDIEDELEERFWEEERERERHVSRALANRRFGANGFMRAGHMTAATGRGPRRSKGSASAAGSTGASSHAQAGATPGSSTASGGKRKKKTKKNSRAGIAAAKAKAEAAAAAAENPGALVSSSAPRAASTDSA